MKPNSAEPQAPTTAATPDRRQFLQASAIAVVAAALAPKINLPDANQKHEVRPFDLDETSIAELQDAMKSGKSTAHAIAEKYLARIDAIDKHGPAINSVIELNPEALDIAQKLDQERKEKGPRGPLHGIPILIKDNIATADRMQTTAGSLALVGSKPPKDSYVAQKLRAAGAVILGKTNLSEWANIRSNHSTSGWSGRGGQTKNPYSLDRNPCGSSSGSGAAAAANLAAITIGTETDGSIVCPSSSNGIVGIKPTVGLISRSGIIPISHTQDGPGPMCRSVRDAATLLGVLTGVDPDDTATSASNGNSLPDYTQFLDPAGLKGARIGIVRKYAGFSDFVDKLLASALSLMKDHGAEIIDPADVPNMNKLEENESMVMMYELKADLNAYLAGLGSNTPVHSLKEVIEFNEQHAEKEMPYFGQDLFVKAEAKGPLTSDEYQTALNKNHQLARAEGIDAIMDKLKLDALVAPTGGPAWITDLATGDHFAGGSSTLAAVAGYPAVTVPMGFTFGLPVGITFFGRAWSEPTLIKLAFAYEQSSKLRQPPKFMPRISLSV